MVRKSGFFHIPNKNKIASRFGIINALLLAAILIDVILVFIVALSGISAEQSLTESGIFLPPIIAILSAFVIFVITSSVLLHTMLAAPLRCLITDVLNAANKNYKITGIGRDDEIGDLARAITKTWTRFSDDNDVSMTAMDDMDPRGQLLRSINIIAAILHDSDIPQFENNLCRCMGIMAEAVDADRVCIWKNNTIQEELYTTMIYEWAERVEPQLGKEHTINVLYKDKLSEQGEILSKGQCINCLACDMRDSLSMGALSVFIAPVFLQDQFWGFIGFDNCRREIKFSGNEEAFLRSGCLLIADSFLRRKNSTDIVNLQEKLESALKEAQTAINTKSAFLAHMNHEIRTPMNSIVGFSELAMDDDIPPRTKDFLGKIIENAHWLLQIFNNVLDISKIDYDKMELEKIPFDMGELFASCKTLIMPKAVEKGIILRFYAEPLIGKKPMGDPARLYQVLVNILSNAVKFTNTGSVNVSSGITEKTDKSVTVYFEIKDSGIGMTDDQIAKIFEPFIQAETGTTRQYGGTGLGLSISKSILELMGGKLRVESRPGTGSKFSFILTFETIEAEIPENKIILHELDKPTFTGEVLLCEDNLMNQQVICEHLARVGLKTVVAENGKIGVDFVKSRKENPQGEKQFDLIFMDMHMPVMDGLEASAKILEQVPDIQIIALTANITPNDREIYAAKGIVDCVGKPFTSQELWRCLLKYLTPLTSQTKDDKNSVSDFDDGFSKRLQLMFVKGNQNKFNEIVKALKDDMILAYRLAHSLKSNAGQIGKRKLQLAAAEVERHLKNGVNKVTEQQLLHLENELSLVMEELSYLLDEPHLINEYDGRDSEFAFSESDCIRAAGESDSDYALRILDTLEPVLRMGNPESCGFIGIIRGIRIPDSNILINQLIQQIDDFEFDPALSTLNKLKSMAISLKART